MNLVAISGIVKDTAKTMDKPGFSLMFFQMENVTGYKDKKRTTVFNVKKMGKAGGGLAKFITKGRYVTVIGSVVEDTYQQAGVTKKQFVLDADNIELGGQAKDEANQTADSGNPFGGSDEPVQTEDSNPFGA